MGINEIFNFGIDFSKMKKVEVIRDIFIFFIIYCIVGWIYEGIVFVVTYLYSLINVILSKSSSALLYIYLFFMSSAI